VGPQKAVHNIRLTEHALERYGGWTGCNAQNKEPSLRRWLAKAKPAEPTAPRRVVALLEYGANARYLMLHGFVAVIVADEQGREACITFHDNGRGWYRETA